MRDPHDVLGVPRPFTAEQLRVAWRSAAARLHPDAPGGSSEAFQEARAAYEYLRDPDLRARVHRGELDLEAALEEISRRMAAALPDLQLLRDDLRVVRCGPGILSRVTAGARAVLHGTRAYGRLRQEDDK